MKADAGAIENVNIAAPARAANEQLTNLRDSTVFSFAVHETVKEEHARDERKMKQEAPVRSRGARQPQGSSPSGRDADKDA
ncbi:hypothetical protein [Methylocapsa sp. S129]|uniref:hypothetical protein n=1 Tax=Methylocapsa sp. S129 TaxID=1641869 RepID=UPI00131C0013|nr:hypothetical protein [Methylocapsa sp. S129]